MLFGAGTSLTIIGFSATDDVRGLLFALAICAWYALAATMPVVWLATGRMGSRTGVSLRTDDPFGFWLGVCTGTLVLWGLAFVMHWALRRDL